MEPILPSEGLAKRDVQNIPALTATSRQDSPVGVEAHLSAHHADETRVVVEPATQSGTKTAEVDVGGPLEDVAEIRKSNAGDIAEQRHSQFSVEEDLRVAASRESAGGEGVELTELVHRKAAMRRRAAGEEALARRQIFERLHRVGQNVVDDGIVGDDRDFGVEAMGGSEHAAHGEHGAAADRQLTIPGQLRLTL